MKKKMDGFKREQQKTDKNKVKLTKTQRNFLLVFLVMLLALIVIPIVLSIVFDLPKIISIIPFDSDVWFTFWVSYFSLISTIILDCIALFFGIYSYEKDEAYKKNDFLYIDSATIKIFRQGYSNQIPTYLLRIFLVDSFSTLTFRQKVDISTFNLYAITNEQLSTNPQLLYNDYVLSLSSELLCSYDCASNVPSFDCRATNSQYTLSSEFCTQNNIIEELYISDQNSNDKKYLYVIMTYEIKSSYQTWIEKVLRLFRKLFNIGSKTFTTHLLLSRVDSKNNNDFIKYRTVYENSKV